MENIDQKAVRGVLEGYRDRSIAIGSTNFLDTKEEELIKAVGMKGFSFPTNEGMRKVTKQPEVNKVDADPVLNQIARNIRTTIRGVRSRGGGLYTGTNAFHHGHLAYLSGSEGIVAYDMNPIVPYGFAFIVGLVGGIRTPEDFRHQINEFVLNPKMVGDFFKDTPMENTGLLSGSVNDKERQKVLRALFQGVMTTMNEFNPAVHGSTTEVPPVFCWDEASYNYFRRLILQDMVAGMVKNIAGKGFIGALATAVTEFKLPDINTLYFSSIFDPRFEGPKSRKKLVSDLDKKNLGRNAQVIESFLNSGWLVYDLSL